ncbi:MAG: dodecin family protein, partial [Halobacteria archaeon]|nr:dodecin family protein [Halobacteria archaeon]
MVFKKVTVIGTSKESWEDAAMDAVNSVEATIDEVKWVDVENQGIELANVDQPEYQTEVTVA